MSTPEFHPEQATRDLVALTRKHIIGQDAAVAAFATEVCRHIALSPLQRRPGVFLITGPNADDNHLAMAAGLASSLKRAGGLYELSSAHGKDMAHLIVTSSKARPGSSLMQAVTDNPDAVFVLQDIDKAHPSLLEHLKTAWSQGCVVDDRGETIPLADTIFILTTEVASEQIGQIARTDPDPARLHVECLKALIDASFPASLLRHVDFTIGLKHLTASEMARAYYERLAALVASHGLVLEEGGLDARILLQAIDPTIEPAVPDLMLPWDKFSDRLAQIKAAGARTVRLILEADFIRTVPVEMGTPQRVIDALAAADPAFSADGEAKNE